MRRTKLPPLKYYTLKSAAKRLGCDKSDLLRWAEENLIQLCLRLPWSLFIRATLEMPEGNSCHFGSEKEFLEYVFGLMLKQKNDNPGWFGIDEYQLSRVRLYSYSVGRRQLYDVRSRFTNDPSVGWFEFICEAAGLWGVTPTTAYNLGNPLFSDPLGTPNSLSAVVSCEPLVPADCHYSSSLPPLILSGLQLHSPAGSIDKVAYARAEDWLARRLKVSDLYITHTQLQKLTGVPSEDSYDSALDLLALSEFDG
ncbi:MAG: hypothetical protein LBL72_06395 [Candidatus Accumulibacter sp.]|jgi:hypothetical protein|nr:hypothetical protein [Accumulibacter sp.]